MIMVYCICIANDELKRKVRARWRPAINCSGLVAASSSWCASYSYMAHLLNTNGRPTRAHFDDDDDESNTRETSILIKTNRCYLAVPCNSTIPAERTFFSTCELWWLLFKCCIIDGLTFFYSYFMVFFFFVFLVFVKCIKNADIYINLDFSD